MMESGVGGQIHGISLDSFLQMAQMEKTTCTLTIKKGDETGFLYMLKGELIDAEAGERAGKDAAFEILSWENTIIEIENSCSRKDNQIQMPLMNVLMEGLKIKDERIEARKAAGLPPKEAPAADTSAGPADTRDDFKDLSRPAEKIDREKRPAEKKAPPAAAVEKKPRKGFPVKIVVAAAAGIIVIVGAVLVLGILKSGGIEKDFQRVMADLGNQPGPAEQIDLLQQFIDAHEPGPYTQQAEAEMKKIRSLQEEQDFDVLMSEVGNLPINDGYEKSAGELYKAFLEKHPRGAFTAEVKKQLSEIPNVLDDADYQKVLAAEKKDFDRKITAYNRYLAGHPQGRHAEQVRTLLAEMSSAYYQYLKKEVDICEQNENWDKCITLCNDFIAAFKDDPNFEEVVALKIRLQGKRDLAELIQAARRKGTDYEAAKAVYRSYLEENPDSIHKEAIQRKLAELEQRAAAKEEWEKIAAYSKDRQEDIFKRYDRLAEFIDQNPSSPFIDEAGDLLEQMREERQAAQIQRRKEAAERQRLARLQMEEEKRRRQRAKRAMLERKMSTALQQAGDRFRVNGDGTVTDTTTGLMWTLLDSRLDLGRCLNYTSAQNYVKGIKTGGHTDWRMPTAGELAGIFKNPPYFPAGGAKWYWSSEAYVKGYHRVANIVTTVREKVFNIEQEKQESCGAVRAVRP